MGLTFVDTCIWIYLLERHDEVGERARAHLDTMDDELGWSPLVRLECLVRPHRLGDLRLVDDYENAFRLNERLDVGDEQYERAILLRARFGLKTPDALHLATAQTHGCRSFWTNDSRLADAAGGLEMTVIG
ncbi:MAG: type II toxin-antitoxin system VapC family toxin [Herbiconiux sp.]|nr:type II toxin-antitoxin system VapC family toxin [Herbiconiux sp.]